MSFTTPVPPATDPQPDTARTVVRAARDDRTLRLVLGTNAATSILGGLAALVAGGLVDELLGTGHPGWVRLVGAGLVAFGLAVAAVARASTDRLVRLAPIVSIADLGWVVFTIVSIVGGWYSTSGSITMALVGGAVAVFGVEQVVHARRLSSAVS